MKEQLLSEIEALESQLVGDMMKDMDTQEKIFDLKRQLNEMESPTVRPDDSDFECIGCGS
ncbi:hypothetical protein E1176_18035 [Fulvivirga sp. RKSG066]|uniref:hypothetical protein n=1 Tax=Fulvivirga aurantia TaxID=2529383 RepID=UPI0012BD38F6|nr:hypothetical protein [Fulvivirga aurantia]MTI22936.1 hypothetical protein [Fulvivirga aurantia]